MNKRKQREFETPDLKRLQPLLKKRKGFKLEKVIPKVNVTPFNYSINPPNERQFQSRQSTVFATLPPFQPQVNPNQPISSGNVTPNNEEQRPVTSQRSRTIVDGMNDEEEGEEDNNLRDSTLGSFQRINDEGHDGDEETHIDDEGGDELMPEVDEHVSDEDGDELMTDQPESIHPTTEVAPREESKYLTDLIGLIDENNILSSRIPNNLQEQPDLNEFDIFSSLVEGKTREELVEKAIDKLSRIDPEKLLRIYGFCKHTSRKMLSNCLGGCEYKPIDYSFLQTDPIYQKPVYEHPQGDFKSKTTIGEIAILYLCLQNLSKGFSEEAGTKSLLVWRTILERDGFQVNVHKSYSSLVNNVNKKIKERSWKVVFCTTCTEQIHIFEEHLENRKYSKETIPVCSHCFNEETIGNMKVDERLDASPYRLDQSKKLEPKEMSYLYVSVFYFFMVDLISQRGEVLDVILSTLDSPDLYPEMKEIFDTPHGKYIRRQYDFLKSGAGAHPLYVFMNLRSDDVASFNNCASGMKTGIQSFEFPQLGEMKKKFPHIICSSISAVNGKPWILRMIQSYFLMEVVKKNYYNPPIIKKGEIRYSIRFILNMKKLDRVDLHTCDRCNGDYCDHCRCVCHKKKVTEGRERAYTFKLYDVKKGLERSVYTTLLGSEFEETVEYARRGKHSLMPLVELALLFRYDHHLMNQFDILHKVINVSAHGKKQLCKEKSRSDDFRTKCDDGVLNKGIFGSFHGMDRILSPMKRMGYHKFEERLHFLTMFSIPLFHLYIPEPTEREILVISYYMIFWNALRLLYSDEFNFRKWDGLWKILLDLYPRLDSTSFPPCFHDFFGHVLKGKTGVIEQDSDVIVFHDLLINILRNDSTMDGETYYTLVRALIKRNFNYAGGLMKNLHQRNIIPIIIHQLDEELISNPNLKKIVNPFMYRFNIRIPEEEGEADDVLPYEQNEEETTLIGDYRGFYRVGNLYEFEVPPMANWSGQGNSPVFVCFCEFLESILDNSRHLKRVVRLCKGCLDPSMLEYLWPQRIKVEEIKKMRKSDREFDFITKNYRNLKRENYNCGVMYLWPVEDLEDDDGDYQVVDPEKPEYFRMVGRILHILKVSFDRRVYYCSILQNHKRVGKIFFKEAKYSSDLRSSIPKTEIVEQTGTAYHCSDLKLLVKHVMLAKVKKVSMPVKVFSCQDGKDFDLQSEPFSLVIDVTDQKKDDRSRHMMISDE